MNTSSDERAWERMEGEPVLWYSRFIHFYLPLGPTRTIMQAAKVADAIEKGKESATPNAPADWSKVCDEWEWRRRADAYDDFLYQDDGVVELARAKLKNSALDAVNALHESLGNARLAVQAAKEILDRAGLPATTNVNLRGLSFTADELAAAEQEVQEWEKQAKTSEEKSSG